MAVRERIVAPERSMVALRAVVAAGAADALGSPDRLLSRVQQAIQHLADGAVFAVERIGVHGRLFLWRPLEREVCLSADSRGSLSLTLGKGSLDQRLALGTIWHTFHVTGDRAGTVAGPERLMMLAPAEA